MPQFTLKSQDTGYCPGETVTLKVVPKKLKGKTQDLKYQWNTPGFNTTFDTFRVGNAGEYIVTVTETTTGCHDQDTSEVVQYPYPPKFALTFNHNPSFCPYDTLTLKLIFTAIRIKRWNFNGRTRWLLMQKYN